jgi:hypothetical protein
MRIVSPASRFLDNRHNNLKTLKKCAKNGLQDGKDWDNAGPRLRQPAAAAIIS